MTAPLAAALPLAFYARPTLRVARALLGKILVHRSAAGIAAGRIVEVEAYRGPEDRAAHTAGGRRTARNEVMWGPGGRLYVYFTYGMHHCCNVVTRGPGEPEAVLLRALEPLAGLALMRRRRNRPDLPVAALARGPGNLCRALGIDRRHDGALLTTGPIVVLDAPPVRASMVAVSPRIGVAYAGDHALRPWRFFLRGSSAVSGRRVGESLRRAGRAS
ncbi:MAG: DNA-3-methyladenine glycosylase [Deltaproteobacteria bacterium]|nr:DNA-3-methyladenine glycosylase [Deltaproteobacteria bacterium]